MQISALYLYPVKSCRRIAMQSASLAFEGFAYDRQWVIVDEAGKFITQRQDAKLALVETHLPPEVLAHEDPGSCALSHPDAALTLSAPGMPAPLCVPLRLPSPLVLRPTKVWAWEGLAADEGDGAAAWLTAYFGQPARLRRHVGHMGQAAAGPAAAAPAPASAGAAEAGTTGAASAGAVQDAAAASLTGAVAVTTAAAPPLSGARSANTDFALGWDVRFQDQFPLLITTEASLSALSAEAGEQLPMTRFRPNIVVAGAAAPWQEDGWQTLEVQCGTSSGTAAPSGSSASVELVLVKPCSRCKMVRIDQETGEAPTAEPTEALTRIRNGEALGWSAWHRAFRLAHFFGWQAVPIFRADCEAGADAGAAPSRARLAVGDGVRVSAARQPLPAGAAMQPFVRPGSEVAAA